MSTYTITINNSIVEVTPMGAYTDVTSLRKATPNKGISSFKTSQSAYMNDIKHVTGEPPLQSGNGSILVHDSLLERVY